MRTACLTPKACDYKDECVRHKLLDVVGDLALAGLPLLGAYRSVRGGHKLNHARSDCPFADRHAWRIVEANRSAVRAPLRMPSAA